MGISLKVWIRSCFQLEISFCDKLVVKKNARSFCLGHFFERLIRYLYFFKKNQKIEITLATVHFTATHETYGSTAVTRIQNHIFFEKFHKCSPCF